MAAYKNKLTPDFSDGVDRKLLKQVRDRFLSVNQHRLDNTLAALSHRHQDILRVLPLLYQVNHALMPGYVSQQTPRGVSGYEPEKEDLAIVRSFSQTFKFRKDKRHQAEIHAIYMMGSTGTLAHSESSDVDLWLCAAPGLPEVALHQLQEKSAKIDAWANDLGLELHTFIMDADDFRAGSPVSTVDAESSGSAQHYLLLDEFYRTAILLAGRYPLWWLIPPDYEADYKQTTSLLLDKRFVSAAEVIDFGSSAHIPKNELVGAGLWQLYKGLDAPYKSVLKLLLAEVYAQELPNKPTLSVQFKQAVYDDELDVHQLDPYVLIFKRLESYLTTNHELKRLDLVRKSFYLKVAKKLSRPPVGRGASWQRVALESMTRSWAWPDSKFRYLDERATWKVDQVLQERQEVVTELSNSYRFLSNFARINNIRSSITSEDLTMLGRKLYAVFQRKAGKIEKVNPGIAPNLWEENLAIHHSSTQPYTGDTPCWLLYRDLATAADAPYHPVLKKSSGLIDLLAWLYFNGIINRTTRLSFVPGDSRVAIYEVQQIIMALESAFPQPLPPVSQEQFMDASAVTKLVLFINVGIDPLEELAEKGMHRLSDRTDSLAYSSQRINLVKTVDQVALNSWNELSAHRYARGETLMQNLQAYLQLCYDQRGKADCELSVHCFCPQRADVIATRVRELFWDIQTSFFPASGRFAPIRYIVEVGAEYYILMHVDGQFRFLVTHDTTELFNYLAQHLKQYSPIILDQYALPERSMLRKILAYAKKGVVQFFYMMYKDHIELIVLDEHGSLLQDVIMIEDETSFLAGLQHFMQMLIDKRELNAAMDREQTSIDFAFYRVRDDAPGEFKVTRIKNVPALVAYELHVSVIEKGLETLYDISLDHQEFTNAEYGGRHLEAMMHQLAHQPGFDKSRPVKIVEISYPVETLKLNMQQDLSSTLNTLRLYLDIQEKIQRL